MADDADTREWPEVERRSAEPPPPGTPRRRVEDRRATTVRDLERRIMEHETDSRAWRAAHGDEVAQVRALLDGSAGNDGGLIGKLWQVSGQLDELTRRLDRQGDAIAAVKADCATLRAAATVDADGTTTLAVTPPEPRSRGQVLLDVVVRVVLPVLLVLIPVLGTIIAGYLQLKGQLINVQSPGGPP